VFAEGASLIAAAGIGGRGAVCGLETFVSTAGENVVVAQYW